MVTYPKLSQAALKQVNSMNFDSPVFIISAIFGILFIIFGVSFPVMAFILIRKSASKNPENLKTKYAPLLGEFSLEGTMPKYFTVVALVRRFITLSSQVLLFSFPYLQISILTALGLGNIIMLGRYRPYAAKSSNMIMIISEIFFTLLHVLIMVGIQDTQSSFLSDTGKINLGWMMIGCSFIVLGLSLEVCLQAQVGVLKVVLKALAKRREKNKITPANNEKEIDQGRLQTIEKLSGATQLTEDRSILDVSSVDRSYSILTLGNFSSTNRLRRPNLRYRDSNVIEKI